MEDFSVSLGSGLSPLAGESGTPEAEQYSAEKFHGGFLWKNQRLVTAREVWLLGDLYNVSNR